MEKEMSKIVVRAAGTAAILMLSTAMFAGTALAGGGNDNASAVGCSASNSQSGDLIPVNAILGNAVNGNNILSNCPSSATAG
jgi:hypothetical protein